MFRYRVEETDDGPTGEGGAFAIRSFWLVSALSEIGEHEEAAREAPVFREPSGLYAEEIDRHTGRHLGNVPQAFSHPALMNAVMHLIREEHIMSRVGSSGPGPLR